MHIKQKKNQELITSYHSSIFLSVHLSFIYSFSFGSDKVIYLDLGQSS